MPKMTEHDLDEGDEGQAGLGSSQSDPCVEYRTPHKRQERGGRHSAVREPPPAAW